MTEAGNCIAVSNQDLNTGEDMAARNRGLPAKAVPSVVKVSDQRTI